MSVHEPMTTAMVSAALGVMASNVARVMASMGFAPVASRGYWDPEDVEAAIELRKLPPDKRRAIVADRVGAGKQRQGRDAISETAHALLALSGWAHWEGRGSNIDRVWVTDQFDVVTERPLHGKPLLYARRQGDLWVDGAGKPLLRVQPRGIEHGIHVPAVTAIDVAVYRSGMASHHRRKA